MTKANPPVLELNRVTVTYGPAVAVADLSLSVRPGGLLAVLGPNGAGKSSLARAIAGLIPVAAGSITFAGRDVTNRPAHELARHGLTYLPEGRGIFPTLSVDENLRMAARSLPDRSARADEVARGYDLFPVLAERRFQRAGTMSGGEQQMLSLARGLVSRPSLLIADEPSLGLAPKIVDQVFARLEALRAAHEVTIILIEQFVRRALAMADDVVVMQNGRIAVQGEAAAMGQDDLMNEYLGRAAPAT